MSLTAWYCKQCGGRQVPLDHFESTPCGERLHPDYPAAILRHERGHHRHGRRVVGVTDVIGCPRKAAMQQEVDYAVDPLNMNSVSTGSAWDKWVSPVVSKPPIEGFFDGVNVVGEADRLFQELKIIRDWKHCSDYSKKYRKKAKEDHRCQVSMYAEMVNQTFGWRPERGFIDYHFSSEYGWAAEVELMSVDEILAYKPADGEATVRENLHLLDGWVNGKIKWQDMPLTGKKQSYGTKDACSYCFLYGPCRIEADGAPF